MRFFLLMICVLLASGGETAWARGRRHRVDTATATTEAPALRQAVVARVIDGDTVVLADGQHVRLLDINAPELTHRGVPAEPYGEESRRRAVELVTGKTVWLRLGATEFDDYGRLLAHIYIPQPDGSLLWLNGTLVREGLAVVYTFADNRVYPNELLALEKEAREAKRGLWALPRWQVRDAGTCCAAEDIGRFMLVDGVVQRVTRGDAGKDGVWYLNFGDDWRTDFTVEIATKDFNRNFNGDDPAFYAGHEVVVHGMLQPVNGVLVRVTHPEQLVIVK